ncbi:MAG: enoyl-CoA hydratase/isomerase family protein, partial [Rhodococcus sp. (in: high G+C Gram-positive bacteria)]
DNTINIANKESIHVKLDKVHTLYNSCLTIPMDTVAAIGCHAFGAGAMLATSHDFQIMRADRGFYCLPEVSLNMPFTVGMSALLNSRLPKQAAVEAMTTGRRFGGADALSAGIVQETVEGDSVLATAVAKAAALTATHGPNLAGIKAGIHRDLLVDLGRVTDKSNFSFG